MNENAFKENAAIFRALADETRLEIMGMLRCGEMCACKILESFDIAQSTLSYHMKILTESGLIIGRREEKMMMYSINKEKVELVKEYFDLYIKKWLLHYNESI